MNIQDLTDTEKAILKAALFNSQLTLPEILKKTHLETAEAESILNTFIAQKIAVKLTRTSPFEEETYSFRYAISNDERRIVDLAEQEGMELQHNISP